MPKKKEIIQFSHANGFPGPTYQSLFSFLEDQYDIQYIDMLGHNPNFPVVDNWTTLSKELIQELDKKKLKDVIGIGHSLGGSITLFAAIERPDLFKKIILLDTPIFSFPRAKIVQLFKNIGFASLITPGGRVRRRRTTWHSFAEALDYFKSRPLFKNFTAESLKNYVRYGTEETPKGLVLKFDPAIEASIYLTLPHNYSKYAHQLKVPGFAIIGKTSEIVKNSDKTSLLHNFGIHNMTIQGGHLFPFEHPKETAAAIKHAIAKLPDRN